MSIEIDSCCQLAVVCIIPCVVLRLLAISCYPASTGARAHHLRVLMLSSAATTFPRHAFNLRRLCGQAPQPHFARRTDWFAGAAVSVFGFAKFLDVILVQRLQCAVVNRNGQLWK